ncbi:AAA family ATPase/60S ribosome export protein Rix7 [Diaporthe helianthi]|uniref:Peroxisomal ATPase PEX1 n=1 Tax=Diaporthe helianthi TaxID=158607 RepID=A0A2P5I9F8_DIAHE|nr:AAA family ATPase/60S ribosome export protein Rix7 [Diaporthe helianthi]
MPISLRQGLDRDVYQIVRKYEDDFNGSKLSVSGVYEFIQRSNSSLKRQKKRILEDSIERVIDVRREESKAEKDSDEELEREMQAQESRAKRSREEKDAGLLNRQLTKHWNFKNPEAKATGGSAASSTGRRTPGGSGADNMDVDTRTVDRQANGEAKPKRRRKDAKELDRSPPQDISLDDLAGVESVIDRLKGPVWIPLLRGDDLAELGYRPSDGVLLHGPSGCGKTTLAHALAADLEVAFIPVSAPSLVGGTSGESEKNIRDIFDEAMRLAPCLVFFDELDSIAGKRDNAQKAMEGRIVAEICNGMDKIGRPGRTDEGGDTTGNVVVLAATNRPESIDPVVRRRFGVEVDIGMPNEPAREKILRTMTRDLALSGDVDFAALARLTPGYVGADLKHVVSAAVFKSIQARTDLQTELFVEQMPTTDSKAQSEEGTRSAKSEIRIMRASSRLYSGPLGITQSDFKAAVSTVQPAAKREGFSAIPDTTWHHVGALGEVRKRLEMTIIGPIKYPERFARVGIKSGAGILLWGPPGCGKTLVAKAVANESKANFISIKGPELLNKYVGESERAVRQLFARAKSSAPCILFFDEMDALVPKRDDSLSDASSRVVNALLTELDGVGDRSGIYVVGATNRPDCIDPAIRRPGRLGTSVFVGLPTADERVDILRTIYWNTIVSTNEDRHAADERLAAIALDERCKGFSGADLGNLMQAAAQASLERTYYHGGGDISEDTGADSEITPHDWEKALNEVKPSVKNDGRYDPRQFDKML